MYTDFQQQLHAQKLQALGQLAGGVAHDFNNILSVIEGYARMLERQLGTDHPAADKVHHILTATKRGANLTKRLLAFGGQHILADITCDVMQVLRDNEVLLRPLLSARVELRLPLNERMNEKFFVPCDADTLSQIIINLAVNARDAMPQGGVITVNVIGDANKVFVRFADTGTGIPDTIISRIFDPFFTTKEQGKGTGLGLSMIAGFMDQIGGRIQVASKPGAGSVFSLIFPRAKAPELSLPVKQENKKENLLANKTVLVVDDEEQLLPIVEEQLRDMGLKVLKAANADKALVMQDAYQEKIDLLLTDVVMPGLNGVRLSELMKSLRPDLGIVYMTGYANRIDMVNLISPLPEDALVIPKPLQPENLSPALLTALDRVKNM